MTVRSFDVSLLQEAAKRAPGSMNEDFDFQGWLDNDKNYMLVCGNDVGLATFEYPGLYNVHWFFTSRGRDAIRMARSMLSEMFTKYGAEAVRGLTPANLKAARWASRQVGLKSYGVVHYPDGDYELFIMTKEEFNG